MKRVSFLSKPDLYSKNLLAQLEDLEIENKVDIYETPEDFFDLFNPGHVDLVIIDITLDTKDTLDVVELVKKIRQVDPKVPIIIATLLREYQLMEILSKTPEIYFIKKLDDNKEVISKILQGESMQVTTPQPAKKAETKSKHKVLVVDDFENTRFVVKFSLEKEGYIVHTAADGLEALQKLQQEDDYDLLIVDLNMPRMNGLQLIEELRKENLFKDRPIIILTTEIDNKKKEKAKDLKITGWIQKPYQLEEFLDIIKRTLKQ